MDCVLDTSALFSMQGLPSDARCFTTPGVLRELKKHGDKRAELWGDMLTVSEPTSSSLRKVREASSRTGDSTRLSPTDIEVLALALELNAQVFSDDYSLQNVAAYLGIPFRPIGLKGIDDVRRWRWRCTGCGRVFDKEMQECPVCGSRLRSTLSRKN